MPHFFGISPGEEKTAPGLRVRVSEDGERVYMHGKWLDLGSDHAVAWIEGKAKFRRADGKVLRLGQFPALVVRGTAKRPAIAVMFQFAQFDGGAIKPQIFAVLQFGAIRSPADSVRAATVAEHRAKA